MKVRCKYSIDCKDAMKDTVHCDWHDSEEHSCKTQHCYGKKLYCAYSGESICVSEFEYMILKALKNESKI